MVSHQVHSKLGIPPPIWNLVNMWSQIVAHHELQARPQQQHLQSSTPHPQRKQIELKTLGYQKLPCIRAILATAATQRRKPVVENTERNRTSKRSI